VIIPGHDPPQSDGELLGQNFNYIRNVASGHIDLSAMSPRQLRAHYPNAVRLAELYIEKADANKAIAYYGEAVRVLDLLEPGPENEKRRREITDHIKGLS
jgi:hypothetical protein